MIEMSGRFSKGRSWYQSDKARASSMSDLPEAPPIRVMRGGRVWMWKLSERHIERPSSQMDGSISRV